MKKKTMIMNPCCFSLAVGTALMLAAPGMLCADRIVTDMAGRKVVLPDEVKRVLPVGHCIPLSLAIGPEQTGVINRCGPDFDRFSPAVFREGKVGIGSALPEHLKDPSLPQSKGIQPLDVERVQPDLLFMEGDAQRAERADELQKKYNIPVIVIDQSMDKYQQAFALLGQVFCQEEQAAKMYAYVQKYLIPIREKTAAIPENERVTYYYAHGGQGLNTDPAGNNHVQPFDYIHAVNIFQNAFPLKTDEKANDTTIAEIARLNPKFILLATMGAEQMSTWKGMIADQEWENVTAFKEGRVYQIPWLPFSWMDRPPGSNRILGTVWLAKLLYPEQFESLSLEKAVQEYFEVFFHKTLSDTEVKAVLSLSDLKKPNRPALQ
ncbi:MAG: ABC transporter substrate-binding protein [Pontiellaceae bacterium]|nr:ABC transporter substrate-binding protein [Pontiellaceae bacterium]